MAGIDGIGAFFRQFLHLKKLRLSGDALKVKIDEPLPSGSSEIGKVVVSGREYPGEPKSNVDIVSNISHLNTGIVNCDAVTDGRTGYLMQVVMAVNGGPTLCYVKQDGTIIGSFWLGGHMGTSTTTSHIAGTKVWDCDFDGLFKIVGDGIKKWTVYFTNNCGVVMDVDAAATFVWREV